MKSIAIESSAEFFLCKIQIFLTISVTFRYLVLAEFRPSVGKATNGTNIIDRTAIILRHDHKLNIVPFTLTSKPSIAAT